MAIVKVKRPKLRWYEHLYLPAIFKGLGITLKHAIKTLRGKAPGAENMASSGLGTACAGDDMARGPWATAE